MAPPDDRHDPRGDDGRPDEGFTREAAIIRSLAADPVELVDAPDDLWSRIAASAAERGDAASGATSSPVMGLPDEVARRRRARRPWMMAAAAAVVAVLIGVGVIVGSSDGGDGPREVARARLAPYREAPVGAAGGTVELVRTGDRDELRVRMHDLPTPAPGTFYELWLLDPETGEPRSVATMRDGASTVTTTIEVPEGIDPARFDVVDVSVQEEAAGPEHSGNSVLRGRLET